MLELLATGLQFEVVRSGMLPSRQNTAVIISLVLMLATNAWACSSHPAGPGEHEKWSSAFKSQKDPKTGVEKTFSDGFFSSISKKVANRFASELEWKEGAPSSHKSAVANGWVQEILTQIAARKPEAQVKSKAAA